MSHCGLAIYIKKYLKAKAELWKLKHFSMQKYIIFKESSKRNQNPSRYYNSVTNLKFQKSTYKNRPIITQGSQNPLSYYTL
jgi:hypothetical protein